MLDLSLSVFPLLQDVTWSTQLSDGCMVDLVPGGSALPVLVGHVDTYCERVLTARLHEASGAMSGLVEGFASIIPLAAVPLLTGKELEVIMCGTGDVDVELLKRNTEYDEEGA